MSPLLLADLTVFTLALLVGFEVISKVPATLHTPLMSGANAIHGVVIVGVMLLAATVDHRRRLRAAGGGRVLRRHERGRRLRRDRPDAGDVPDPVMSGFDTVVHLVYLACATCFVIGLHLMNAPATARRGNRISAAGMAAAILTTVVVLIHGGQSTTGAAIALDRRRGGRGGRRAGRRPDRCR